LSHALKVESESARALVVVTPGGFERMFEEGGTRWARSSPPLPRSRTTSPSGRATAPAATSRQRDADLRARSQPTDN